MRRIVILISLTAFALAAILAGLGPAYRLELLDLGGAFGVMRKIAVPTLVGAGLAGVAFVVALFRARGLAGLALLATLAAGAAAYAPIRMKALAAPNPFIHAITTDFEAPPEIVAAAGLPRKNPPGYVGADKVRDTGKTVAEAQREAFPDIAPLEVGADSESAATAARKVLGAMKMEILADEAVADGVRRIEAVHTSLWYGFKDDFIVRLTAVADGTRIDVRSKSRVGGSDLGANAARVRKFLAAMDAAL